MTKIPTLTLTPCRSTGPRRMVRIVMYRRCGDVVEPYLAQNVDGRVSVDPMRWRDIHESEVDSEFAAAWLEHVKSRAAIGV